VSVRSSLSRLLSGTPAAAPPSTTASEARQGATTGSKDNEVLWLAHALTKYPCRMADGRHGQVAVLEVDGEWTLVCKTTTAPSP
jgi:hypothetical protein